MRLTRLAIGLLKLAAALARHAEQAGAAFVKTSTGFGPGGALGLQAQHAAEARRARTTGAEVRQEHAVRVAPHHLVDATLAVHEDPDAPADAGGH